MATPILQLEGSWEEIAARAGDFAGRRLRVTVLADEGAAAGLDGNEATQGVRLAVLREIELRATKMAPRPDPRDFLREGRSGGMFSRECSE